MDLYIKLNAQAGGRDKIIRLLQYLSRTLWDFLQKHGQNQEVIDKLKSLEFTFSSFRKLLRLGKCIDVFYSSLSTIHYPDLTIRITLTLSKLATALFLFADHIIWFARSGVFQNINLEKWNNIANRYWLMSITLNLVRDVYEIMNILKCNKGIIFAKKGQGLTRVGKSESVCPININDVLPVFLRGFQCVQGQTDVFVDTIKNACDFFIPLTALGYTRLSPAMVGSLGVVSSIAGILALVKPMAKLTPS